MRRYFLLGSIVSATLVSSASAFADSPQAGAATPPPADSAAKPAPAAVPLGKGKPAYSAKVMKGHAAYVARDFQGAIAAYKDAIKDDANDAFAHYFLGEAQLAAGNIAEADASFAAGLRVSELTGLRLEDLSLHPHASILVHGKGRKERCLPLWKQTTAALRAWLAVRNEAGQRPGEDRLLQLRTKRR